MKRTTAFLRDSAIVLTAICSALGQFLGGHWTAGALAVLAGGLWITTERKRLRARPLIVQVVFVITGILLVWSFNESRMWLSIPGMWFLVSAGDLSRLVQRFPVDSVAADQRLLVQRRLQHLGLLGLAAAILAVVARVLTLELRLTAVALLAVFVVMVMVRVIRSVDRGLLPDDEQHGG